MLDSRVNTSKKIFHGRQGSQHYFNQNRKFQGNPKQREQNVALQSEQEQQQNLLPFLEIMLVKNTEGLSLFTLSYISMLTLLENGRKIFMT